MLTPEDKAEELIQAHIKIPTVAFALMKERVLYFIGVKSSIVSVDEIINSTDNEEAIAYYKKVRLVLKNK